MRVIHVIDSLGGGGGAEHALRLQLPELARSGVESEVICLKDRVGPLSELVRREGTPVTILSSTGRVARAIELRHHVRMRKPDLVHATLFESCLVSRLALMASRTPLINSLVNTSYTPVQVDRLGLSRRKRFLLRTVDRATAKRVDHFHALTRSVKCEAVDVLGVSAEKITIIPRGRAKIVADEVVLARRAKIRESLGIGDVEVVVLNVGRQEPQKGQHVLIQAMPTLARGGVPVTLLIAGREGSSSSDLRQELERLGRDRGRIHILGYRTDISDLVAISDIFAFPSYYEGLGSALIEAMAGSLPIVASDIGPIREVLDDGRAGVLVPPGDPLAFAEGIRSLIEDKAYAAQLGEAGHARFLSHYQLRSVVNDTLRMYERVLGDA